MKRLTYIYSDKKNILLFVLFSFFFSMQAQVVIHETDDSATPDANAILDVTSTTKGVLIPNLSESQRDALPSPTAGLLIYNRTTGYFNYFNNTAWMRIARDGGTSVSNPATTETDVGVGIGIADPDNSSLLHINANNKGLLLPRVVNDGTLTGNTTGLMYYNSTDNTIRFYNGSAWGALTGSVRNSSPNSSTGTAAGVIIGTGTVDASAKLELKSTDKGFLLPRLTTTQRNAVKSPAEGLLIYNTTTNQIEYYLAANWYAWN